MGSNAAEILRCEQQLRSTLHGDDKEKLRKKLAVLQREYLRTAQRLQRAERSDAVRRHVRSRIAQQHHQDRRDPAVPSDPWPASSPRTPNSPNGTDSDSESRRPQLISFSLPSDGPQTADPCSPALRLRSRRSRLRWERRSAEAGVGADNTDEGREQSDGTEADGRRGSEEERVKREGAEAGNESEELFSGAESESLLLTHWNSCGKTKRGDVEGKEGKGGEEESRKETELRSEGGEEAESASPPLTCGNPEGRGEDGSQKGRGEEKEGGRREEREGGRGGEKREGGRGGEKREGGRGEEREGRGGEEREGGRGEERSRERDGMLCEDGGNENTHQNATMQTGSKKSLDGAVQSGAEGSGLLESCTLVEGLLFPAEYYVRTTRRMTSSQRQPDMQAVILSQLSGGRRRRRGGGCGRAPSGSTPSPSVGRREESDTSAEPNTQSSGEISHIGATSSPAVAAGRPPRGRRRRREGGGRGGARPRTPRGSHQRGPGQTSDDPQTTSSSISSSPSLRETPGPESPGDAVPVPDDAQPASPHGAASLPSGGSAASGHRVYPIFQRSSDGTNRHSQRSSSENSSQPVLLPSSPPAKTLSSVSLGPLVRSLMNLDVPQDFHLPDDQFASLKLHKLRQVALESGDELLSSPSYNTRRSIRRYGTCDPVTSPPPSLSPTHTVSPSGAKQDASQTAGLQHFIMKHKLPGKSSIQSSPEESPGENAAKQLHPEPRASTESVSSAEDCAADQYKERREGMTDVSSNTRHGSMERSVKSQPNINAADGETSDFVLRQSEEPTGRPGLEDLRSTKQRAEDEAVVETLSHDCLLPRGPEEPINPRSAAPACDDGEALDVDPAARESRDRSEPKETGSPLSRVHSQFLLSPPLASAPSINPHLCSPLPMLGLTPHLLPAAAPLLTPSPPAPALGPSSRDLSPRSPSSLDLPPPHPSPRPSLASLPPSQPPASPAGPIQAPSEAAAPSGVPSPSSGRPTGRDGRSLRGTATLKAPAGGRLVDACCLPGPSGGLIVAAAGSRTVCLWSPTAASDWSLTHTWTFDVPVINVFPVPDAAGLICVTLGPSEIREVRTLSCSSLLQELLYEGRVQAVVAAPRARVVTSSLAASGSTLQVFALSDGGSALRSRALASPGVCVGALAPVDGTPDALIGSDADGCLFVWNLRTGQLLQRILIPGGSPPSACLRGFSHAGVLFVLLQHPSLGPPGEEDPTLPEEERETPALLSLVAINPLSGKSVPTSRLLPPERWSGRLRGADVSSGRVVGVSHSGGVCVWEVGRRGVSAMVDAPDGEGWRLARWGGRGDVLLTGHHDGDVTLHSYSSSETPAKDGSF